MQQQAKQKQQHVRLVTALTASQRFLPTLASQVKMKRTLFHHCKPTKTNNAPAAYLLSWRAKQPTYPIKILLT
ncbi:UNVERIFIED_CONTAM: hypothetical protein GTU68_007306 [Idotea baltica]|nr:hypothetical protein [Idotea baltica]